MTATSWTAMWLAALALWVATPTLSHAQLLEADLRVNGMTCPFCAFGIEKKLRAVEGVEEVNVLLDEGEIRLTLATGNSCTVREFEKAVEQAGFELAGLSLAVRGIVTNQSGEAVLEASEAVRFRLLEKTNLRIQPISDTNLQRILGTATDSAIVVTGTVDGDHDGIPGLVLEGAKASPGGPG